MATSMVCGRGSGGSPSRKRGSACGTGAGCVETAASYRSLHRRRLVGRKRLLRRWLGLVFVHISGRRHWHGVSQSRAGMRLVAHVRARMRSGRDWRMSVTHRDTGLKSWRCVPPSPPRSGSGRQARATRGRSRHSPDRRTSACTLSVRRSSPQSGSTTGQHRTGRRRSPRMSHRPSSCQRPSARYRRRLNRAHRRPSARRAWARSHRAGRCMRRSCPSRCTHTRGGRRCK